jgi:hypothetical protein
MSHLHGSNPQITTLPDPTQTRAVFGHYLFLSAVTGGFSVGIAPPHDLAEIPLFWRSQPRWMLWTPHFSKRLKRPIRTLLRPDGVNAKGSGSRKRDWRSLEDALHHCLEHGIGDQGGGVAVILEDPQATDPRHPNRAAMYFRVPPAAQLHTFLASPAGRTFLETPDPVLVEILDPPEEPAGVPPWLPDAHTDQRPAQRASPELSEALKHTGGWVYGYVPLVKQWLWLQIKWDDDAPTRSDGDALPPERRP